VKRFHEPLKQLGAVLLAGLALAGCTANYGPGDLGEDPPVDEAVCSGAANEPGCAGDNPICTDPSDYRCDGP
jgi:hypothetical protein